MNQSEMPLGSVITIGHPANRTLAAKGADGWRYLANGRLVRDEDFREGWNEYPAGAHARALAAIDQAAQNELDLHQCSFEELPALNKVFVHGIRRAREYVVAAAGPAAAPAEPVHLGERANAEECPACTAEARNLPYPWLCPAVAGARPLRSPMAEISLPDGAAVRELADKAAQLSDTELGSALRAVLPSQPGDARALLFALLGAIDGALENGPAAESGSARIRP